MNKSKGYLFFFLIVFCGTTARAQVPPSQDFLWARNLGGTAIDETKSIAVDASGNVYTTGTFRNTVDFDPGSGTANQVSAGYADAFISKLDAEGNYVWVIRIGGSGDDDATAIAVDNSGNVYVTGKFGGTIDFDPGAGVFNLTPISPFGKSDLFILNLDTDGNFLWARNIGGTEAKAINSIAVDNSRNVYTTGFFEGTFDFDPGDDIYNMVSVPASVTKGDVFISKLDASGNFVWAKQLGGSDRDEGHDITVDDDGNVYTTGRGTGDFDPGENTFNLAVLGIEMFVSKLDASGNFVWAKGIGGNQGAETGYSIALDASGNVYTTGNYYGTADFDPGPGVFAPINSGDDAFISKLDADGNFVWASSLGFPSGTAESFGIAIDAAGNVYTTGSFNGRVDFDPGEGLFELESTGGDIYIRKLDASGGFGWAKSIAAPASNKRITGYSIAVDDKDNVYATGYFIDNGDFDPSSGIFNLISNGYMDGFILKIGKGIVVSPTISGFSPQTGNAGTLVTINGTNFNTTVANNIVRFNGKHAKIVTVASTRITALVPSGATTGKISVTTSGGTAETATDFTVTAGFTVVSGLVKDIIAGPTNSITFYSEIVTFKDYVYFSVNSVIPAQYELWRTDGTTEGTTIVSDNYHGNFGWDGNFTTVSTENYIYFTEGDPRMLVAMDQNLNRIELTEYPSAYYNTGLFKDKFLFPSGINNTLHVFDEVTKSIYELNNAVVPHRISKNNHYAYVYSIFNFHNELFRTDGTREGTVLIHAGPIAVEGFMKAGADDYFIGHGIEDAGTRLFRTNGSPENTVNITGLEGLFGIHGDLNGTLLMSADANGNEDVGNELYTLEGNSIVLVKDIHEGPQNSMGLNINEQVEPVVLNDIFYFGATSETGQHLWRSDGTEAGTYMVKELFEYANFLTVAGDKIYFSGPQRRLWVTDGTEAGTKEAPYPANMIHEITLHKGHLYFVANTIETGMELHVYNLADALIPSCDLPKPTISISGSTLTSSSTTGNQWLLDGTAIPGATEKTFSTTQAGSYSVQVTAETCSDTSEPLAVTITITGLEEPDRSISIYPNPASSIVRIECESHLTQGVVEVYNIVGVQTDNVSLMQQEGTLQGQLDVGQYPPGIYILKLKTAEGERRYRIEKI